ncbi:glycosyltransferase family 4 protein [Gelidibacter salicanalis]|uniref:Glycosyltransferase family 4 protein n=1 Tax=Gelidibacter salicanalis TaxID=291193 RepID=A0A934KHP7_9FLAO|nr:glycosyltransferase family 4 protein [Gelidibacter salicanalis]MBJ7879157.1 glycosyltransferase family 4 protein [Gelidibacter salicanalis]
MKKLAIISTHPIQYNAPWFKLMATRGNVELKVFYTWSQAADTVKDKTFGQDIKWDIPLLEGYDYEFVENVSKKPGSHHFFGIDNPALITQVKAFTPDALLCFGWSFKSHFKAMRYFHGKIPVWFRGDSTLLDETGGIKTSLRRLILKTVYRYVDKAFYVGQANKAYFLKHGLKEHQLVYAPHAVNNAHFEDTDARNYEHRALQWKRELGIPEQQTTVIFAGKFEKKKQPDVLIDAIIAANKNRQQPIALVMIGSGPMDQVIKEKAKRQDNIWMLPFQNQTMMPLVYRLGSVFCLPSQGPGETWGLAMNEAMASSRPVIATDKVGGVKDMVLQDVNSYCFQHDQVSALVEILETLSSETLKVMGLNAKEHSNKFTLERIVMAVESTIGGSQIKEVQ